MADRVKCLEKMLASKLVHANTDVLAALKSENDKLRSENGEQSK